MLPRFLVDAALAPTARIELDPSSAHHALKVLRLRPGDTVELFNGDGRACTGRLLAAERGRALVEILECGEPEPPPALHLTLAQGLATGERMDWIVEKAVELGVSRIVPLACARSVARLEGERAARRLAHWQQLIRAASMQCRRNRLAAIEPVRSFEDFVRAGPQPLRTTGDEQAAAATARVPTCTQHAEVAPVGLVLSPDARIALVDIEPPRGPLTLIVGPESGMSTDETELAIACGYVPVRLGPRVLRTETAGLAALAALQARFGDFRD